MLYKWDTFFDASALENVILTPTRMISVHNRPANKGINAKFWFLVSLEFTLQMAYIFYASALENVTILNFSYNEIFKKNRTLTFMLYLET